MKIYQGNTQILDHYLTTDLQGLTANKFQYIRANADFSSSYFTTNSPSDHDGFVLFLDLENELSVDNQDILGNTFKVKYPNPSNNNRIETIRLHQFFSD